MTNSRAKGSKNERNVAKLMQDWSGYEFARTPQSGGLHWKKQHTSGDIVCIDDKHGGRFPISIECKFHEDFDLLHLISGAYGKKSIKILDFWRQSEKDANQVGKVPFVFMRRNGMRSNLHFIIMSQTLFQNWLLEMEKTPQGGWVTDNGIISYKDGTYDLVILNSDDLIKTDYIHFYKAARKIYKQTSKLLKNVT